MNIKFSVFRSLLKYTDVFEEENKRFIEEVENSLHEKLTETTLEDYDCDLKLLFIQTGGSEGIFLKNISKIKPPFYLLTNGGNNSLAASLEILTYARLNGYNGEVLHGDTNYIAQRILALSEIGYVKRTLSKMNFGVIGTPSDWLISSIPNEKTLKEKFGINLIPLPLGGIEKDVSSVCGSSEIEKANTVYENIKRIVKHHQLNGLTIRCFDLLSSIKMTGCLALAKLNEEGIVSSCEGDVSAMLSMALIKVIFNQSSFQSNPSRIDSTKNEIIFAHCTIPLDMLTKYEYTTHFESGIGIAIKGVVKETEVTIFRLSASLKEYTILEGKVAENLSESNLCRTQIKVKCLDDVTSILKKPCGNHHIIFYGHHKKQLEQILVGLLSE